MVADYYSVDELMCCLEIERDSAEELLDGTILFKIGEIKFLAEKKSISIEKLMLEGDKTSGIVFVESNL